MDGGFQGSGESPGRCCRCVHPLFPRAGSGRRTGTNPLEEGTFGSAPRRGPGPGRRGPAEGAGGGSGAGGKMAATKRVLYVGEWRGRRLPRAGPGPGQPAP